MDNRYENYHYRYYNDKITNRHGDDGSRGTETALGFAGPWTNVVLRHFFFCSSDNSNNLDTNCY